MSFAGQVAFDALRCAGIAAIATALGWPLGRGRIGTSKWCLLLAPLLTPALVISYTCAPIALSLTDTPHALLAFYSGLLVLKLAPLAALARKLMPPSLSPEGAFCARLLPQRSMANQLRFRILFVGGAPWLAGVLIFLLTFADFELASLLSVGSWTVKLFDAQAGGIELAHAFRLTAWPTVIQIVPILVALALLIRTNAPAAAHDAGTSPSWWMYLLPAAVSFLPIARILSLALGGVSGFRWSDAFGQDFLVSVTVAAISAGLAWLLVSVTSRSITRLLLVLPALFGSLVLAIGVLRLSRSAWVPEALGNSPFPLIIAEALLLMPAAVLIRFLQETRAPTATLHLARMAGSRKLLLDLAVLPRLLAFGVLFMLAFFEFTAADILAPIGLTPVFARLHNLAHYGQTAVLSWMLLAAFGTPAALLALTVGVARLYARRDVR